MRFRKIFFSFIFILFIFAIPGSFFIINPVVAANGGTLDLDIGEKRAKSELIINEIDKLGADIETYINDRIPYRNYLIMADRKVNGVINAPIKKKEIITEIEPTVETEEKSLLLEVDPYVENYPLLTSENGNVILGQSNWLYYNIPEIMAIYKNELVMDENMLSQIENEFKEIDEIAKSKGVKVHYVIAPEKQEVYEEYMPTIERQSNPENLSERVVKAAKKAEIDVIYPRKLLKSYKDKYRMYKKYDSHWNQISAWLATNEFYKQLGMELPDIETMDINKIDEAGWAATVFAPSCRDLVLQSNMNYEDYPSTFEYEITNYNGTENPYKDKAICVIGDSFSVDMQNIIVKDFPTFIFVHGADELPLGNGLDRIQCADIIIYELVERHIPGKLLLSLQNLKKALQMK